MSQSMSQVKLEFSHSVFVAMTTEHDAGETAGEAGGDGERHGGAREKLCQQNQHGQGEDVLLTLIVC